MAASKLSRFQGSLVGGVVGDCIGAVFEGGWFERVEIEDVLKVTRKIQSDFERSNRQGDAENGEIQTKKLKTLYTFTDDTAMARSVAKSLIQHNKLDIQDMAKRFTEEYMLESDRGYGGSVTTVFQTLHKNQYADVFTPAKDQFDGKGSYGNGGGMRIAPAGLFACKKQMDFDGLKSLTENITRVTHTHPDAVNGAILQSYAVYQALTTDKLDTNKFVDDLIVKMQILECKVDKAETAGNGGTDESNVKHEDSNTEDGENRPPEMPYCRKLEKMREFVNRENQPSVEEINKELGTGIAALESVPAAVYCFLRASKPIEGLQDCNEFERTILYSISHGGDTDTVATMAGAIAGAYYGLDLIPSSWQWCCEGVQDALKDAELMFNLPDGNH